MGLDPAAQGGESRIDQQRPSLMTLASWTGQTAAGGGGKSASEEKGLLFTSGAAAAAAANSNVSTQQQTSRRMTDWTCFHHRHRRRRRRPVKLLPLPLSSSSDSSVLNAIIVVLVFVGTLASFPQSAHSLIPEFLSYHTCVDSPPSFSGCMSNVTADFGQRVVLNCQVRMQQI